MALSYRAAQTAIKRGDDNTLGVALASGLDPNLANANGWTLLMLAAVEGRVLTGQLLLQHGARMGDQNNRGETALSLAAQKGHREFLGLLERGSAESAATVTTA